MKYSNTYLEIEKHTDIGKELKVRGFQCNTSCKQESNIMNRAYNVYQTSILYVSIVCASQEVYTVLMPKQLLKYNIGLIQIHLFKWWNHVIEASFYPLWNGNGDKVVLLQPLLLFPNRSLGQKQLSGCGS